MIAFDAREPFGVGIQHGWSPYGPPSQVTKARGATAVELDYESAFDVYQRTAASRGDALDAQSFARFAMTHPLGIPQANGEFVIRDPLSVDPDGSVRFVAEIPDGSLVRVMEGSARTCSTPRRAPPPWPGSDPWRAGGRGGVRLRLPVPPPGRGRPGRAVEVPERARSGRPGRGLSDPWRGGGHGRWGSPVPQQDGGGGRPSWVRGRGGAWGNTARTRSTSSPRSASRC